MRIAIAQVKQESNTFSPVHGTLEDFEQNGLFYGTNFLNKLKSRGEVGGFLDIIEQEKPDAELFPILYAFGHANGRLEDKVLRFFEDKLVEGLKKAPPIDGILFALHGAACAEGVDDIEGYLLSVVRGVIGNNIPIVVSLDHHANITRKMVQLSNLMVGTETQPHNHNETGRRAAQLFFSLLRGDFTPTLAWEKIPLIVGYHERLDTAEGEPMKEWFDLARKLEKVPGVISISNFPMQPWLDIEEAGLATIVYTDNDSQLAKELVAQLANKAWSLRERFWKSTRLSPQEAVSYAVSAPERPIILSDPSDTIGGAPCDSTCILQEMLRQKITCSALVPIYDPEVYRQAATAGLGSTITVKVGGKFGSQFYSPVEVTGKVTGITEGFEVDLMKGGKKIVGSWSFMIQKGTVILEAGSIKLLISESRITSGRHPGIYRFFGIEPNEAKLIVMKTGTNFRDYNMVKKIIRVDCPGYAQGDLTKFEWKRAPRPIYPMDKDTMGGWHANPKLKLNNMQ